MLTNRAVQLSLCSNDVAIGATPFNYGFLIGVVVDELDLHELGFCRAKPKATGWFIIDSGLQSHKVRCKRLIACIQTAYVYAIHLQTAISGTYTAIERMIAIAIAPVNGFTDARKPLNMFCTDKVNAIQSSVAAVVLRKRTARWTSNQQPMNNEAANATAKTGVEGKVLIRPFGQESPLISEFAAIKRFCEVLKASEQCLFVADQIRDYLEQFLADEEGIDARTARAVWRRLRDTPEVFVDGDMTCPSCGWG
jgi:hypothetical protein